MLELSKILLSKSKSSHNNDLRQAYLFAKVKSSLLNLYKMQYQNLLMDMETVKTFVQTTSSGINVKLVSQNSGLVAYLKTEKENIHSCLEKDLINNKLLNQDTALALSFIIG